MDAKPGFGHSDAMPALSTLIALPPPDTLDQALRLIAVGEMALVALIVGRSKAGRAVRRSSVLMLAGVIGYLLQSIGDPGPTLAGIVLELGASLTGLAVWLFAHALFSRRADWRLATVIGTALAGVVLVHAGYAAPAGGTCPPAVLWIDRLGHGIEAGLVLHALAIAILGRADDLSEKRRRFALAFVGIVAGEALVVVGGEAWFGEAGEPVALRLAEALLIIAAGLVIGGALLDADAELIGIDRPDPEPAGNSLAPAERVLHDRLIAAMEAGAWRRPALSIGDLAADLAVPEHRLRALINRRLGHRNFSAFLNIWRLGEAKRLLSAPDHVALPVLTIAMDCGYGSLAPFNRAFREATGLTPTDFRRAAFAGDEKP